MPYAIQPIEMKDVPGLARAMMTAFYQDAHWRLVWSNMTLEQIIDGCRCRLPHNLTTGRDRKRHQKVIETASGEIVGYARWVLSPQLLKIGKDGKAVFWPEAQIPEPTPEQREIYESEWQSARKDGHNVGSNQDMIMALSEKLDAEDERIKGGEEWLELEYLATAPSHQNRGVGALLMRSGLEKADATGVNVLVMASTDRGKKLYERCGFSHVSTIVQDDSRWGGSATGSVNHWYIRRKFNPQV